MVNLNKQITLNGISSLVIEGDTKQIAYLTASIPVGGSPTINHTIQELDLFNANKEEVLKDFAAFDAYVYDLMEAEETKATE